MCCDHFYKYSMSFDFFVKKILPEEEFLKISEYVVLHQNFKHAIIVN